MRVGVCRLIQVELHGKPVDFNFACFLKNAWSIVELCCWFLCFYAHVVVLVVVIDDVVIVVKAVVATVV